MKTDVLVVGAGPTGLMLANQLGPPHLRDQLGLSFEALIPEIRDEAGTDLTFQACSWLSTYRIHHRCVERFRDRRCFLLGDAAHVHSPVGGQGMNTGLQDAYNLAWKLALVVKDRASDSLLETYEQERRAIAQNLLRSTDRAFSLIVSDTRFAGIFRARIFAKLVAFGGYRSLLCHARNPFTVEHGTRRAIAGVYAGRMRGGAFASRLPARVESSRCDRNSSVR